MKIEKPEDLVKLLEQLLRGTPDEGAELQAEPVEGTMAFLQCAPCLDILPLGMDPREFMRLSLALMGNGSTLGVFCERHHLQINQFELAEKEEMVCRNLNCKRHGRNREMEI